ncbi:MAG: hypothetical protein ACLQBB_00520 [Solirubrobacteraceae bacterium]
MSGPPNGSMRVLTLVLALLAASAVPASASAVTIAQHPLPGPYSPAQAIQGWAGGLAVTRSEGGTKEVLQRITSAPAFSAGPVQHVEALTLGTGPDGDLWLVGGHPVAGAPSPNIALEDVLPSGALQARYAFPGSLGSSYWPEALAAGPDGSIWVANLTANAIERISPAGAATTYPLPRSGAPTSIAVARDGSVWFTELGTGAIGEITPDGTVIEREIGAGQGFGGFGSTEPYAIVLGPDGALWFTEQNAGRIGRMTVTGQLQEFTIPDVDHAAPGLFGAPAPRSIVLGPDGALWFTDDGDESIGRITTSGQVTEYPITTASAPSPQGITSYAGQLWFAEAGVQALGSVDPNGVPATPGRAGADEASRRDAPLRHCPTTPMMSAADAGPGGTANGARRPGGTGDGERRHDHGRPQSQSATSPGAARARTAAARAERRNGPRQPCRRRPGRRQAARFGRT